MVLGAVVGLVLLEPDLGTAVTVSLIAFIILYVAGLSAKTFDGGEASRRIGDGNL